MAAHGQGVEIDSLGLLVDFINMRSMTLSGLEGFYKRNNLSHLDLDVNGVKLPGNAYVVIQPSMLQAFTFSNVFDSMVELDRPRSGGYEQGKIFLCRPNDFKNDLIEDELLVLKARYRDFIDECIGGHLDMHFLNSLASMVVIDNMNTVLSFNKTSDPWKPMPIIRTYNFSLVEMLAMTVVQSFIMGAGDAFSRVRRCLSCGKYFIVKSKKGKFCGVKCRVAYHLGSSGDDEE